jgi:(E)-4-hydroxy-3-methylbut-2-enyl-diphosphate synthase
LVLSGVVNDAVDPRVDLGGAWGALLVDGVGDAVRLTCHASAPQAIRLAHQILQAARCRLEQAEYIACPSCGRTLFDLESTTARIRQLTSHLKLKIAVMGCVVNGPGEMADADFGFVGWGEGKVALFVGKQLVERDIPYAAAPERLIELIRGHGRWTEPEASSMSDSEQLPN